MRSPRFVLALLAAVLLLALPQTASAKEGFPLRVVTPSGKVGWVRGSAADAWWHDYDTPGKRGCSCTSAGAAARYASGLFRHLTTPGHYWPGAYTAWLLSAPNGSMLYYPPTRAYGTHGVVLTPAAQGSHGRRWDHWQMASPRMENILRLALRKGTLTSYGAPSGFPAGWWLGGGLGALLLAGLILGGWRRLDLSDRVGARVRHVRYRLSS
ncbi:MAG TPA: hypothetical protein VJ716_06620 [Gaiellaceae bacterium]|nr:hypothetical protein [Gaiellaceae bacterium]